MPAGSLGIGGGCVEEGCQTQAEGETWNQKNVEGFLQQLQLKSWAHTVSIGPGSQAHGSIFNSVSESQENGFKQERGILRTQL